MNAFATTAIVACLMIAPDSTLFAQDTVAPTANFTLRDDPVDGTADLFDAMPDDAWFDGLLTVNNGVFEDRHFVEFDMSLLPASWDSVTLTFTTAFSGAIIPDGTFLLSSYRGNGNADLSDWSISTTELAMIPGVTRNGGQTFAIDVTSLTASFEGSGFLGVRFELLDSQMNQKELLAATIVLTGIPEPSSALLGIVGLATLFAWIRQSRTNTAVA